MPPPKVAPETPIEIEDVEQWNAITDKGNADLNVIDVYSEWCGPCMCESTTVPLAVPTLFFFHFHRGPECLFPHPAALLTRGLGTAGLSQTYKRVLFDNDETLALCKELENKTIKYWTACTEKMSTPTEEDGPKVENVEQYAGDPMPHLLIYLKGDLKATINVRFAGSVVSAWRCVLARAPRPLRPAPRPRPRVTLTKASTDVSFCARRAPTHRS
jgi:hypothetical protein